MTGVAVLSMLNSPWYPYWTFMAVIFIVLSGTVEFELPNALKRCVVFASNISFDFYLVHLGIIRVLDNMGICDIYGSLIFVLCASVLSFFAALLVYWIDKYVLQRVIRAILRKE